MGGRRHRVILVAGLALLAAACRAGTATGAHVVTHTTKAGPSPSAASKTAPTPSTAAATPAPPALLQRPSGDVATLAGTVTVDTSYLVATGAGSLVSDQGSELLAAGGGIIANNGGGLTGKTKGDALISDHGGAVVALASGNVISDQGGSLISDHGGGLLSDVGSGIIANNGGGIVANNGGSIVAHGEADPGGHNGGGIIANNGGGLTGKTKFGLLSTGATPAFGAQAIAAGMQLQVLDMTTDQPLALGLDAKGKPVYTVFTNLAGGYEVYLPVGLATNVRVVTGVPGHDDPRSRYSAITVPTATAPVQLDDDAAAVTRYLRQSLGAKFATVLEVRAAQGKDDIPTDAVVDTFFSGRNNAALMGVFTPLLKELFAAVRENPRVDRAHFVDLALQVADVLLAHAGDLSDADLDTQLYGADTLAQLADNPLATGKALPNMAEILRQFREAVAKQNADLTAGQVAQKYDAKPYIQRANAFHALTHPDDPKPYYVIEKATDLADFVALEYFPLVRHTSYGCVQGTDCPSPTPKPKGSRDVSGPLPDVDPEDVRELARGVAEDVGIPSGDISILETGAESVVARIAAAAFDPSVRAQVRCMVLNYGNTTPSACPVETDPPASN